MHHRALRHLPSSPATNISYFTSASSPPLTFTQVLQVAAGRAWVRRASSHLTIVPRTTGTPGSASYLLTGCCGRPGPSHELAFEKPATTKRYFASRSVQTINLRVNKEVEERIPNGVVTTATACNEDVAQGLPSTTSCPRNKQETTFEKRNPVAELLNSQLQDTDTPETSTKPTFRVPLKSALIPQIPPSSTSLPLPTTQRMLYDNLRLSLFMKPLPNLPALIDYHDSHPRLRSSESYNFLIELSIRHAQFGIARWLFDAMIQDGIPQNSTTYKLKIRQLVRTGKWELAWTHASGLSAEEALDQPLRNGLPPIQTGIPWYLWLELLFSTKRGAQRPKTHIRWTTDEKGKSTRVLVHEKVTDPSPGTRLYLRQQRLLACVHPLLPSSAKEKKFYQKLVKGAIYAMLRDGRASAASELTKKYLLALPPKLSDETAAQWMDIIHLLLCADTRNGLTSLYANRRVLASLLKSHPCLKPSSTTLFLLLAPLKRAKKGGTVASKVIKQFRVLWGPKVVDSRVRRRVGMLAQKEGRMDIVRAMVDEEMAQRVQTAAARTPTLIADLRGLRRPADRELFLREGKEEALWKAFRARTRREQDAAEATNRVAGKSGLFPVSGKDCFCL